MEKKRFEDFEEKTLSRQDIFKNQTIDVKYDTVILPDDLGLAKREIIFRNGLVAGLILTEENKMVLVRHFRKALEKVIYEIPSGELKVGEDEKLEDVVLREIAEGGMTASDVKLLAEFYAAPNFCNELTHLYKIERLTQLDTPPSEPKREISEHYNVTLSEAKDLVKIGEIIDAKTIMAIQYWELETNA
jgi:ADP-ribose pyrophosphatase